MNSVDVITTLAKYGVGAIIAVYLVFWLKQDLSADVKGIRAEHAQMGVYLQAICLGVTKGGADEWRCYPQQHGPSFSSNQILQP